jgi:hypothetical protein
VRSLAGLIRCSGGLLSLKNLRETPFAYRVYRDDALTLREKELFRKLPIPYEYQDEVAQVKECRQAARRIYADRSNLSFQQAKEDSAAAKNDLAQKEAKVRELLTQYGLQERQDAEIRQAVKITLLGCWDTVGSLGVPRTIPFLSNTINAKHEFHDCKLSSIIQYALHAVSIDEPRSVFNATPMERGEDDDPRTLRQAWFPGGHGCVGGGSKEERELSDATLEWMMDQINHSREQGGLDLGLEFDRSAVEDGIAPDHRRAFDPTPKGFYKFFKRIVREIPPGQFDLVHESTRKRWRDDVNYRVGKLKELYEKDLNKWSDDNPPSSSVGSASLPVLDKPRFDF